VILAFLRRGPAACHDRNMRPPRAQRRSPGGLREGGRVRHRCGAGAAKQQWVAVAITTSQPLSQPSSPVADCAASVGGEGERTDSEGPAASDLRTRCSRLIGPDDGLHHGVQLAAPDTAQPRE